MIPIVVFESGCLCSNVRHRQATTAPPKVGQTRYHWSALGKYTESVQNDNVFVCRLGQHLEAELTNCLVSCSGLNLDAPKRGREGVLKRDFF